MVAAGQHDSQGDDFPRLWTSAEVARAFRVDTRTVARWRKAGKLTGFPTPGGYHHRYYEDEVLALLAEAGDVQ